MEKQWSLESIGADGTQLDFTITKLPCRIGRSKENDLVIANLGLSRVHAVLSRDISGQLTVGAGVSVSGSYSKSNINADYASVNEQSGIMAGDGGYKVWSATYLQDIPNDIN